MAFGRSDLREILGDAYTDEIGTRLVTAHRSVLDPIRDDLDSAKRESAKLKAAADKTAELQKKLEEYEKGEDWKAKYEKEKADHDAYRAQVAKDAETAKEKLLTSINTEIALCQQRDTIIDMCR